MVSIVVPVYNSEKTLPCLCKEISTQMDILNEKYEIILIDDNSKDNSFIKIKELCLLDSNIKGIKLLNNYGQQNAILCGLRQGRGSYFVTIDDDLQYSPKDIPSLINEIRKGNDVVYGIPLQKNHSSYRNVGTLLNNILFNILFNKPNKTKIGSFRIINRKTVDKIKLDKNRFVYISAATFNVTKNVGNIYVDHYKRTTGKSNYNMSKLIKLFFNIYIYYNKSWFARKLRKNGHQYIIEEVIN